MIAPLWVTRGSVPEAKGLKKYVEIARTSREVSGAQRACRQSRFIRRLMEVWATITARRRKTNEIVV